MNEQQYEALKQISAVADPLITLNDLKNITPRTLLYGYTSERDTWHVYISEEGEIKTVCYSGAEGEIVNVDVTSNSQYIPSKRLYAECCDFEFCSLLKQRSYYLSFTNENFGREVKTYYGRCA